MMQSAEIRQADDRPEFRRLDLARNGRVIVQRLMRPSLLMVTKILSQNSFQMPFAEHDDVIEAFATNRTDQPLDVGILPRTMKRDPNVYEADSFNAVGELAAVDAIVVADEILRRGVKRKGFADLLSRPRRRWVSRDVEMKDAPSIGRQDEQDVQQTKRRRRHDEEIDRRNLGSVIFPEGGPCSGADSLRSRRLRRQVLGNRRFGDTIIEQLQLGPNPRHAPKRILRSYSPNQITQLPIDSRPPAERLPAPEQSKPGPMPTANGRGLHDDQSGFSSGPNLR